MTPSFTVVAAVTAGAAMAWSHVKAAAAWLRRLVVSDMAVDPMSEAGTLLLGMLKQVGVAVDNKVEPRIYVLTDKVTGAPFRVVGLWDFSRSRLLMFRRSPVLWLPATVQGGDSGDPPGGPKAQMHRETSNDMSVMSSPVGGKSAGRLLWIRGTVNVDSLLEAWSAELRRVSTSENRSSRFAKYQVAGASRLKNNFSTPADLYTISGGEMLTSHGVEVMRAHLRSVRFPGVDAGRYERSFESGKAGSLVFPPECDGIVTAARRWLASGSWYRERDIPWRMSVLLHGTYGTGKSTFAVDVARTLEIPVYTLNLSGFSDGALLGFFNQIVRSSAPCVVVLDDFDRVFHGDKNLSADVDGAAVLSFQCLLGALSGPSAAGGILLFIVVNNPNHVDAAIGKVMPDGQVSRPGRADYILEMPAEMCEAARRAAANRLLDGSGATAEEIEAMVSSGAGKTSAQFELVCVQEALRRRFSGS